MYLVVKIKLDESDHIIQNHYLQIRIAGEDGKRAISVDKFTNGALE